MACVLRFSDIEPCVLREHEVKSKEDAARSSLCIVRRAAGAVTTTQSVPYCQRNGTGLASWGRVVLMRCVLPVDVHTNDLEYVNLPFLVPRSGWILISYTSFRSGCLTVTGLPFASTFACVFQSPVVREC